MAKRTGRIARDLMDEPHLADRRVSVRRVHALIEERGLDPCAVADSLDLDVADVHLALTYYHDHPEEMEEVERRRERRIEESRADGAVTGLADL